MKAELVIFTKNFVMAYQYTYDADGNPVGVFIPINEWEILTGKLKKHEKNDFSKARILKGIKKGMVQVDHIKNKKIKSIPLQKLLDEL